MQNLKQNLSLSQTLSPQQIQFIKLLQIPTVELAKRIEEELEINPALEEGKPEEESNSSQDEYDENYLDNADTNFDADDDYDTDSSDVNLSDYMNPDELSGYKMQGDGNYMEEDRESPMASQSSLIDSLLEQLNFLSLNEKQHAIGVQIIGSLENDGYLHREISSIVNDLAFLHYIETTPKEVEDVLKKIQSFDPAGIAARDIKECLLIQLKRLKNQNGLQNAIAIVENCIEDFKKKHYQKIAKKLHLTDEQLSKAIKIILRLNPKPGETSSAIQINQTITPDFNVWEVNGKLEISLNIRNAPELRINKTYLEMMATYEKNKKSDKQAKETARFVKQKIDAAKWFIDALRQRQYTLINTMRAIVNHQYEFFLTGDESKLKPMILKDIAQEIGMDISTVSRVANSKAVQTEFGIYLLKYFFSESISTEEGEDVSSREVKSVMKELIAHEDKQTPLSDDELVTTLQQKGYNIARRTVAKYREQLGIPVARLRKEMSI